MINEQHCSRSVKLLEKVNDVDWFANPVRMHYVSGLDCKAISPAQAITLKKFENNFTAILRHEATIEDTLQSLLKYMQAS